LYKIVFVLLIYFLIIVAECGSSQVQLLIERLVILAQVSFLFFSFHADIQPKPFSYVVQYHPVSVYIMQLKVLLKIPALTRVARL
jgi:hypothetical protein